MSESPTNCPFIGLAADRTLLRHGADLAHRCYAVQPPGAPDIQHQVSFCLAVRHTECPSFPTQQASADPHQPGQGSHSAAVQPDQRVTGARRAMPLIVWGTLALVAVVVAFVYVRDAGWFGKLLPTQYAAASQAITQSATVTPTPVATISAVLQPVADAVTDAPTRVRYSTPTPEAGGRTVTLSAKAGEAGWWTGGEARGNHLGDSFLYVGFTSEQPFISAVRFDLESIARGAPIRAAELRLTGLKDDRFDPAAAGTWSIQLLPGAALPEYARTDFQTLLNAPAAVTLFPTFAAADLDAGRVNVAALDEAARAWLEAQLRDGETEVIARIVGPGSGDSLFAWDAGAGTATAGEGPQLVLALGPAPATAPPLPTEAILVATDTPTPANVLTAAVHAADATATAMVGTPAFRFVTPTPSPANIATLQARALQGNFAPIVPHTPTPANEATAEIQRLIATAEAFLTGTPTPPAPGFVTPVIVTPTPQHENVMTAAAYAWTATAEGPRGAPTPWAYNVIVATVTPPVFVIVDAPTPANGATATIRAAYATAVAALTGTFTPYPYDAVTATPTLAPGAVRQPTQPAPVATPTATPTSPAAGQACSDPRVQITAPKADAVVSRQLELRGRAVHEAFAGYVVELASGARPTSGYQEAFRSETPVEEGVLGNFVLTALPDGAYTLALKVLTSAGEPPPPCLVVIQVRNE